METRDIMRIAAFIPQDQKGTGQGVQVYFRDGSTGWQQLGLRSFIKQIARVFTVNLQESRRRYGQVTGRQNLIPLVLSPFLLYVPLKVRKPVIAGDPAYGYFRLRSLLEIAARPQPCTLLLEGGHHLTITQSYRAVCSHLRTARKLETYLIEQVIQIMEENVMAHQMQVIGTGSLLQGVAALQNNSGSPQERKVTPADGFWLYLNELLHSDMSDCPLCVKCKSNLSALVQKQLQLDEKE